MKLHIYYIIGALAVGTAGAAAQNLQTEVVVDRTVEPAERAASRPDALAPRLVLPAVQMPSLATARYDGFGAVTRSYNPLSPIAEPVLPELSPYRGYASLGYFPAYNLDFSAGYRILNTERTRLGVWGQFNGETFKTEAGDGRQTYNGGRLGADLNQAFGANSHLLVKLSGGYQAYKSTLFGTQTATDGSLSARWLSKVGRISYTAAASADIYHFSDFDYLALPATARNRTIAGADQRLVGFNLGGAYAIDSLSRAGLDLRGSWLLTTDEPSTGVASATPYYSRRTATYAVRLGVELAAATGYDSGFKAAPEVHLAWTPTGVAAIWLSATGGPRLNSIASLRQYTPCLPGAHAFARSNVPVDARVGFNFGPFDGFSASVSAGYAIADAWLMPCPSAAMLAPVDLKAWRADVRLSYDTGSLLAVSASAAFAPHNGTHAWYEWLDRAKQVYTAEALVRPLGGLEVRLGYEFRCGRHIAALDPTDSSEGIGCMSNLRLGASYRITDALSVFGRGENLLGRRYGLLHGIESQKACGIVGVEYKF